MQNELLKHRGYNDRLSRFEQYQSWITINDVIHNFLDFLVPPRPFATLVDDLDHQREATVIQWISKTVYPPDTHVCSPRDPLWRLIRTALVLDSPATNDTALAFTSL
jgi:hypothetical protein